MRGEIVTFRLWILFSRSTFIRVSSSSCFLAAASCRSKLPTSELTLYGKKMEQIFNNEEPQKKIGNRAIYSKSDGKII